MSPAASGGAALTSVDVAVVGGGLVGASAALSMHRAGRSVTLIEPQAPPAAKPAWDERCIGLNAASVAILEGLGIWQRIRAEAAPIRSTVVCEGGRFGSVRFDAAEAGLEALGYNTPLRAIHQALLAALDEGDVPLLQGRSVSTLAIDDGASAAATLSLDDGSRVAARLVMACDGTDSALRQRAGIAVEAHDYAQTAIVSTVGVDRDHGDCAWERFLADGPLAVLPRAPQRCTVVWTLPHAEARSRLEGDEAAFVDSLQAAFGERLGSLHGLGRRMAWPLRRVYASAVTAPRMLLAGNAAQTLHPVAAQGFNLGLRDCAAAAAVAADCDDPGDAAALARYAGLRAEDRRQVAAFTDRLVRIFSSHWPGLRGLRHGGLAALAVTPAAHRAVMLQNLGLPALARLRAVPA